ncbi:MAG TPA: hypothetical protein VJT78_15645 [Candidatus Dormibacteraeota bacterium]|nr:hypothetical protein [Candidatus Dormibacteraeota bacterium]
MNDDFRRELGRAFDEMSGAPSPALSSRVRSSLAEAPERRGPFWIAGLAAAGIAALVIGVLFVGHPLSLGPRTAGPGVTTSPTPTSSQSTPAPSATPSATQSPAFVCSSGSSSFSSTGAPAVAFIDALRTGSHPGYERLTVEFKNGQPSSVEVTVQKGSTFTQSPSGQTVTLKGTNGILVTIHGADLHTDYSGSIDIFTGGNPSTQPLPKGLVEVRRVQDFEGVVQLALGVQGTVCYQATWLSNPSRLVIDVQTA